MKALQGRLKELEGEIDHVVDAIARAGGSDVLQRKLELLEHQSGDIEPSRAALKELLGDVVVTATDGGVFATMALGAGVYRSAFHGAQDWPCKNATVALWHVA